ncbi:glutamate-cysteine ligase family protein [Hamadaea sp. NPDC051192]|uniref:glutamate-cysteine ligase family protein n=1 Tax=Hamadaea sp. NPDC051192 TaxID=3154940 RepID=UPI003439FEC2
MSEAFGTSHVGRTGLELEWIVIDDHRPHHRLTPAEITAMLGSPHNLAGNVLTFEPGGQLELSTPPAPSLADCIDIAWTGATRVRAALAQHDVRLADEAIDIRPPRRVAETARYAALERRYDTFGSFGRIMMCNSASVQINIDAGDTSGGWSDRQRRWHKANLLGPTLVAMFANSARAPWATGRSVRQLLRMQTDPSRTDPPALSGDCLHDWSRYALDAHIIGILDDDDRQWRPPPAGLTMRSWLRDATPRPATLQDLQRHLHTLIPPVRARGYLELRMIDAQAGDNWTVPATVVAAAFDHPPTAELADDLAAKLEPADRGGWSAAARVGLADPTLAATATALMDLTLTALPGLRLPAPVADIVRSFAHRYTFRGRSPADDRITP